MRIVIYLNFFVKKISHYLFALAKLNHSKLTKFAKLVLFLSTLYNYLGNLDIYLVS